MPEVLKSKRIFQIAKELNISHLEIMNYLNNKGEEVSSHMSPVSQEIYDNILLEFSKDKQKSERFRKEQARKRVVSDIRKKKTDEEPLPKKTPVRKIKTVIKDDDIALSGKLKQASEKLKKDKEIEKSLQPKEDKISKEVAPKINGAVEAKSKTKPTKE